MLRVGLTGGIGAGKSTVSARLAELGAVVVDADRISRAIVAAGTPGFAAVVEEFGDGVVGSDGELDRPALASIVFADVAARRRLEAITHPMIAAGSAAAMAAAPASAIVVHDMPLLVEQGIGARYHLVINVHVDAEVRLRRLVEYRGMGAADARARMTAQAGDDQRRRAADVWVDNSGTREQTEAAVDALWRERLVPFEENLQWRRPATLAQPLALDAAALAEATHRVIERLTLVLGPEAGTISARTPPDPLALHLALRPASRFMPARWSGPLAQAGWFEVPGGYSFADPALPAMLYVEVS